MKQVFFTREGIGVEEVSPPNCNDNSVLVRTSHSLISSGTETSGLAGKEIGLKERLYTRRDQLEIVKAKIKEVGFSDTYKLVKERLTSELLTPTGYSLSGIVIEKGRLITDLNITDRVACAGSKIANHAEIVSVPRNLVVKIPSNVEYEEAAFVTLGSIAMQGIRRAGITFGDTIVILGLGLLGLLGVQIAKAAGCKVIGIDLDESRIEMARGLGANLSLNPTKTEAGNEVSDYTKGMGADAVVIYAATKSSEPANQAMRMCRKKGRVVVVGDVGMELQRRYMYEKELDFVISTSYGPGRYDRLYEEKGIDYPYAYVKWTENRNMEEFLKMISEKKIDVKSMISMVLPIEDAPTAFQNLLNSDNKPVAVLLTYPHFQSQTLDTTFERKISIGHRLKVPKTKNEKINIGVIGAGNFAQRVHLPNLKKINGYYLRAVVNQHGEKAKMLAKRFDAEYATTDYNEVLSDKNIDAVLIVTHHDMHASITIEAAKASKSIFVEKPMALNYEELTQIEHAINQNGVNYTVGFNRRYSALSLEAKKLLADQKPPYLINCRINAGFLPRHSWVQDPIEGGGRIIGECCHFFDLFNFLIDEEVIEIDAKAIPINNRNIIAEDNLVATVKYKDGSMAVLTYVAIGNKSLPKERIEIFSDGSSMVINDFEKLELYGYGRKGIKLRKQDKGQYNELLEFLAQIRGESSTCLTLSEAITATEMTFKVVEKLNTF